MSKCTCPNPYAKWSLDDLGKAAWFLKLTNDTTVTCTRDLWNVAYKETFVTDRSLSQRHLISADV